MRALSFNDFQVELFLCMYISYALTEMMHFINPFDDFDEFCFYFICKRQMVSAEGGKEERVLRIFK